MHDDGTGEPKVSQFICLAVIRAGFRAGHTPMFGCHRQNARQGVKFSWLAWHGRDYLFTRSSTENHFEQRLPNARLDRPEAST